ncbi:MAG: insulinase family protein [Bryobacterales bacterium]|nr:insulinase family protein [Bryobacterales bacterium]
MLRTILTVSLLSTVMMAQPIDRTKPPETPALPAFKLPPLHEFTLTNGLPVVLIEDTRLPMVTLRLAFQAGSKYDPAGHPGLSEAVSRLLTEGTASRPARELAEEITGLGGAISASSNADHLMVAASGLSENLDKLVELTADIVRNANFPKDEVELYQQNRKQELQAQRAQAAYLASEKFNEVVFGQHPYARRSPTPESIDATSTETLAAFRDKHLMPNNAVLVLLGNLPPRAQVRKMLETRFGDWKKGTAPKLTASAPPKPKRSITVVNRPGSVQADIQMGRLGLTRTQDGYFPLVVGNTILGGGASSRLFNDIREKRGFAYSVGSGHAALAEAGVFRSVMQVRNEVVEPAIEAMTEHLAAMGKERVSADELSNVKNYLSGTFVMSLETQAGMAGQVVSTKALGLPNSYLETYTTRIRATEPDQIQAIARQVMSPESISIVVVGDAKSILPAVEKFGEVDVSEARD